MAQDILYRLNYVYGGDGTSNDTRPTDNYDLNYNFGDKKALIKPATRYRGGLSIFLSSLGSLSLATLLAEIAFDGNSARFFPKGKARTADTTLLTVCGTPLTTALTGRASPKGKPRNAAFKLFVSENKLRPSSVAFCDSFPPGGSQVNKAINIAFPSGGGRC